MSHPILRSAATALLALAAGAPVLRAQTRAPDDSTQVARLAGLGRLWGAVKYFHPAPAERPIDWDSALVATIPKVRAARTSEAYAAAIQGLLAALGDPATRVLPRRPPAQRAAPAAPGARWAADSTLVLTIPDPLDYAGDVALLSRSAPDVARAPRVVFDLRTHGLEREPGTMAYIFDASGVAGLLAPRPLAVPALRSRMYSGFPTQVPGGSSDYWGGFAVHAGALLVPRTRHPREHRVAFVVDPLSDVPPAALALQQAGLGAIVGEGAVTDVAGRQNTWTTMLPDSVRVAVRIAEYVDARGDPIGQPDTVVTASTAALRPDVPAERSTAAVAAPPAAGARPTAAGPTEGTAAPPPATADPALDVALALVRAPAPVRPAPAPAAAFTPPPERDYREMGAPSLEYRLLAAFRYWNAIRYFYPYLALTGEDWNRVLVQAIPEFEAANDSLAYALAVARLSTRIHDSHGFVGNPALRAWLGAVRAPVKVRYIEGQPVVTEVSPDPEVRASGIRVGDVVVRIDGETAAARRARLAPYIASSTPQALDAMIAGYYLLSGPEGSTAALVVRGADGRARAVRLPRRAALLAPLRWTRLGPAWKILPGNIGYVDLEKLTVPQVDAMFEALKHTRAIVFDNRSYPQGTAWPIAPRLTRRAQVGAALFQRVLATSPDSTQRDTHTFVQTLPRTNEWRYLKPTVMLVDERTVSQAEHTGLFFQAANGTKLVGSPTMGANGDVTALVLPGGTIAYFTGQAVRYPDGRQLQRVGLKPDVFVRPTIAGIRAGRDEVLERAVRYIETGR